MYEAKNFEHLLGTEGFSDVLLRNHLTLYEGYAKNTNTLLEKLPVLDPGSPEFNELNRRFGWEFNGMRLHEIYFENLSKENTSLDSGHPLAKKIDECFGSFEKWQMHFNGMGTIRGIGWVLLYYDTEMKRLFNVWIDEHDRNHLAGEAPILLMDMWEHAFMIDYGLDKKGYIGAFLKNANWRIAMERFNMAK